MSAFKQFKQSFARIFRSKSEVGPNYGSSSPPSYLTLAKTRSEDRTDGDELLLSGTDIIVQDVDGAAAGDGDKTSQNSSDSGGAPELFLVTEDFAGSSSSEKQPSFCLVKGQHVEVIEWPAEGGNEQCRVRIVLSSTDNSSQCPPSQQQQQPLNEGLVPMSVLRQFMSLRLSNSRNSISNEMSTTASEGGSAMATAADSPSSSSIPNTPSASSSAAASNAQRKTSFKKLFSNPVRKLSQNRGAEKLQTTNDGKDLPSKAATKNEKKGNKLSALKNFLQGNSDDAAAKKEPPPLAHTEDLTSEEQRSTTDTTSQACLTPSLKPAVPTTSSPINSSFSPASAAAIAPPPDDGGDEEAAVELPPPMQEIQPLSKETLAQTDVTQSELSNSGSTATRQLNDSEDNGVAVNGADASAASADDTQSSMHHSVSEEGEDLKMKQFKKRQYVIVELIETERDYVRDLGLIVDGYLEMIKKDDVPKPAGLELREAYIVFGNIHQIYDWHRETFMPELEKALEEAERVATAFIRYERRLYMYVKYCENKPKSEFLVAEYFEYFEELRQRLGHRLQLPDLLIKPVQRIMKYQLLLKDILKHTQRMGEDTKDLEKALHVMCVVPKAANDMMSVGRLQGYDGKLTSQGKLLLQDNLQFMDLSSKFKTDQTKFKDRRVFLFEQVIIVSEEIDKRKNNLSNTGYIYKTELKVNKMAIDTKDGTLMFIVYDKLPHGDSRLLFQAPSEEVKQVWVTQIASMLNMQGDFMRALTSPITYQKELTKDS